MGRKPEPRRHVHADEEEVVALRDVEARRPLPGPDEGPVEALGDGRPCAGLGLAGLGLAARHILARQLDHESERHEVTRGARSPM